MMARDPTRKRVRRGYMQYSSARRYWRGPRARWRASSTRTSRPAAPMRHVSTASASLARARSKGRARQCRTQARAGRSRARRRTQKANGSRAAGSYWVQIKTIERSLLRSAVSRLPSIIAGLRRSHRPPSATLDSAVAAALRRARGRRFDALLLCGLEGLASHPKRTDDRARTKK